MGSRGGRFTLGSDAGPCLPQIGESDPAGPPGAPDGPPVSVTSGAQEIPSTASRRALSEAWVYRAVVVELDRQPGKQRHPPLVASLADHDEAPIAQVGGGPHGCDLRRPQAGVCRQQQHQPGLVVGAGQSPLKGVLADRPRQGRRCRRRRAPAAPHTETSVPRSPTSGSHPRARRIYVRGGAPGVPDRPGSRPPAGVPPKSRPRWAPRPMRPSSCA
jgi:hypothetical protein